MICNDRRFVGEEFFVIKPSNADSHPRTLPYRELEVLCGLLWENTSIHPRRLLSANSTKKQQHSRFPNRPDSDRPKRPNLKPTLAPWVIDDNALGRSPKKETATRKQTINRRHLSPRFSINTRLPRERASERQKKITYTGKEEADAGTRAAATWLGVSDMCDMRAYSDLGRYQCFLLCDFRPCQTWSPS